MYYKIIAIAGLLWAGMILGISFLESWVKFRAPSLTRATGLEVGRVVFNLFYKVQCVWLVIIISLAFLAKFNFLEWNLLICLSVIFIAQWLWFFPKLSKRVDMVLAGNTLPRSPIHALNGVAEILKLFLLLIFSIKLIM